MGGTSKLPTTTFVTSNEPRIVHEAMKTRAVQIEEEISKPAGAGQDSKLLKMLNN